jgi:transposase
MKEVTLRMSQKQINRYHVIKNSLEGQMTVSAAAVALGISERQVTRLRNGVKKEGAAFLIHKNTNRIPSHALTEEQKQQIVELYRSEKYQGANFLHFSELLAEHENIIYSETTVRNTLSAAGIISPKKRRRYKPHRRRKRKEQEGLLIQMDATPYAWFGSRAKLALHGAIDDATGKIVGAYMTKNECLQGYYETMRQIIEQNGVPIGVYADRHTIFRSPNADKLTIEEQLSGKQVADTQFGRAMKELGITLIAARSPQAKGRIERLWDTLQSRLVIEFRLRNIKTVHEANAFLAEYIPKFNEQFAVVPEQAERAYAPLTLDLDLILCVKEKRVIDNGGVFSFHGKLFKVISGDVPSKTKIEVIASATKGIIVLYKGKTFDVLPYINPKKASNPKADPTKYIPPDDHYYKHGKPKTPLYSSDLVDFEIHTMLNNIFLAKYL